MASDKPPLSAADGGDRCIGCCRKEVDDPKPAEVRGNCSACDKALRRAIDDGDLSEEQALSFRLWLPRSKRGRKPKAGMHAAIRDSLKEQP